jgi:hypothetical protein
MNFGQRSRAYQARLAALDEGAKLEAGYRRLMTGATYLAAATYLALHWATISAPMLFVTVIGVVIFRAIGNALIGVWARREVQRIEVANPIDAAVPSGTGEKP